MPNKNSTMNLYLQLLEIYYIIFLNILFYFSQGKIDPLLNITDYETKYM